jgi:hypothetical protein
VRGATAGIVAAAAWAAAEPALGRLLGTPYSDVRLLGRFVTRSRLWPAVGVAVHLANGAAFGALFERAGLRGIKAGVAAAQIENLALWPGFAVIDRIHPDRRTGYWPPLTRNARVVVYELATHALFGFILGALTQTRSPRSRGGPPASLACGSPAARVYRDYGPGALG